MKRERVALRPPEGSQPSAPVSSGGASGGGTPGTRTPFALQDTPVRALSLVPPHPPYPPEDPIDAGSWRWPLICAALLFAALMLMVLAL